MPALNFQTSYQVGSALAMSSTELINRYLFGIPLCTQNGVQLNIADLDAFLSAAQDWIEQSLEIKLNKQIYHERCDFIYDQWKSWGYVKTTLPVRKVHQLSGFLNSVQQVQFPDEWCSVYMNENDPERAYRNVYLVPNGGGTPINSGSVLYLGITPHLGFWSMDYVPNYWDVWYSTGFDKVPDNILNVMGKMAAIQALNVLGDVLYQPGVASQSLSFDGLSQSVSTTASQGNLFKGRIAQYQTEIEKEMKQLREIYRGIAFMTL